MENKDYKVFIVEGKAREPLIIDNILKVFFKQVKFKIITLPVGQNIYMLWKKLKEDDFDTDIIEVLREENEELKEQLAGLQRDDFLREVFRRYKCSRYFYKIPNYNYYSKAVLENY